MNQQYVEGVQKRKRAYLRVMDSKIVIAILALLFSDQKRDNVSTVQRTYKSLVCLMVYQLSSVIQCQIYPSRRTVVVLFNP